MKKIISYTTLLIIIFCGALPLVSSAQNSDREYYGRPSFWRPYDQRGINVFETNKTPDTLKYEGARVRFGAGFTQQYQSLKQENTTALNNTTSAKLYPLQSGFMTAQANLFMDIQLADGIRLNVTSYMSSRHHNETWVKGGYIQFDKLPFKGEFWTKLMEIATIKVGHMEVNYGDAHFRRSDGGQTLYNPFMDNLIVDDFATEIGGEVYLQKNGLFGMVGLTGGMMRGSIDSATAIKNPDGDLKRAPSIYLKGGIDKTIGDLLRVRVSGSFYHNSSNAGSGLTIFGGDRTGSNYQNVMENAPYGATLPASTAVAFSGRVNPGFSKKINAFMFNGFLKVKGLELFGTLETAKGRTSKETVDRKMTQLAAEAVYRFGAAENLFIGARYNAVSARLANTTAITYANDIKVNRTALAAGWFVTKNVEMKAEYVIQKYKDYPTANYLSGGKFNGVVVEAVVGF
ncbi:MAG: hypothetical protein ABIS01_05950 [Ferruginibacter sp.]